MDAPTPTQIWVPTRAAARSQLAAFVPRAGEHYAAHRNYDEGWEAGNAELRMGVSGLSPWIQRRLLLESEVVRAVVEAHGPSVPAKFIQEVLWRTYWKGWLAMRPSVWEAYQDQRERDAELVASNGRLARAYARAVDGETGIACFDHWAHELQATGYVHNHARMWFASIWIFSLRLPWTLGAALFERHLLDGDAASNTLSWRWVAGLHTRGKHYVARASNIAKFTRDRFDPRGQLDEDPRPLVEDQEHPRQALPLFGPIETGPRSGLLLSGEDLCVEQSELGKLDMVSVAGGLPVPLVDPTRQAPAVQAFHRGALDDGLARAATHFGSRAERLAEGEAWCEAVVDWAHAHRLERVVAVAPHVGPWQGPFEALERALQGRDVELALHRRQWDLDLFPHAKAGYFKFKKAIPGLLERL